MKALLACLLLMAAANPLVAGTLTLTVEVYRFTGETNIERQSPETQLALLADPAPVVSQKLELVPGTSAQSSAQHDAFTLKINATAKRVKEAAATLHLDYSLSEEVAVGSETTATTYTTSTKLTLKFGERTIVGFAHQSAGDEPRETRVFIASLTE